MSADGEMNAQALRQAARHIPYFFAKANGIVLQRLAGDHAEAVVRDNALPEAIAEMMRVLGIPVHTTLASPEEFEKVLAAAYAQGEDDAATLVGDVEQDMDLSQLIHELPKTEDLLDAENDAPVIRMINALLTQALRGDPVFHDVASEAQEGGPRHGLLPR